MSLSHTMEISGDVIDDLPTDETPPSPNEVHILDTLFTQKQSKMQRILASSKDVMIVGLLFAVLALPQIDELIKKFIPSTQTSTYILIFVKVLMIMFLYFILKNWYLSRSN